MVRFSSPAGRPVSCSEAQIAKALRQGEAGMPVEEICRKLGFLAYYNLQRTHQGYRLNNRTPFRRSARRLAFDIAGELIDASTEARHRAFASKALGEELFDFYQNRHDAARVVRSIEAT